MQNVIVGTSGHVDHGKTCLIKALTGIDTDRLKEEQKRGITIELGFANLPNDEGLHIGIIDVPGHEKFVKNMLAGIGGIDLVLFVVGLDEGVMPQTVEHFEILKMLHIRQGIIVFTKADLVDDDWAELVEEDVRDNGARMLLNFGHTIGHAVEQCSDFSLLHGEAVAIGMATVTRAAVKRGICGEETLARLLDILRRYGLPTETGYELDKLYEAELVDKKISGGKMHLIVPEKIGQVRMETIPVEALRDWMQDGGIR